MLARRGRSAPQGLYNVMATLSLSERGLAPGPCPEGEERDGGALGSPRADRPKFGADLGRRTGVRTRERRWARARRGRSV